MQEKTTQIKLWGLVLISLLFIINVSLWGEGRNSINKYDDIIADIRNSLGINKQSHVNVNVVYLENTLEISKRIGKQSLAYYSPIEKTIYMSKHNKSTGVLIHELTHAVIYDTFTEKIPSEMQEIICCKMEDRLKSKYYFRKEQ
jgi:hypothetical protein